MQAAKITKLSTKARNSYETVPWCSII